MSTPKTENLTWHQTEVSPTMRRRAHGHRGATIWLTGLSGSGKSTIAHRLERMLVDAGVFAYVLDGDNLRLGLNADLGFSEEDRRENIRRVGELARLFTDAGAIVITAFISPYADDRERARSLVGEDFVEVYVAADLSVCESRDPKGLYAKARAGEIAEFTGISAPYEEPTAPEVRLDTGAQTIDESAAAILRYLTQGDFIFA